MTHPGFGSAPPSQACDDGRPLLSASQRQRTEGLLALQQGYGWQGELPVLLLERCWLRLEPVSVQSLGQVLPPDASGAAVSVPKTKMFFLGQPFPSLTKVFL